MAKKAEGTPDAVAVATVDRVSVVPAMLVTVAPAGTPAAIIVLPRLIPVLEATTILFIPTPVEQVVTAVCTPEARLRMEKEGWSGLLRAFRAAPYNSEYTTDSPIAKLLR
jgi:hypothetical protein